MAALRSLLMQALHPLAMAGVDQHSSWRRDPVGTLAATLACLPAFTFGDLAAAMRASAWVRHIQDPALGRRVVMKCSFPPARHVSGRDHGRTAVSGPV